MAWCKTGTGTPRPGTLGLWTWDPSQSLKVGPRNSLKFKNLDPKTPSKFKSGTKRTPPKFKLEPRTSSSFNIFFFRKFHLFFFFFYFFLFQNNVQNQCQLWLTIKATVNTKDKKYDNENISHSVIFHSCFSNIILSILFTWWITKSHVYFLIRKKLTSSMIPRVFES